jgi:hypothetical protein
MLDGAHVAVIMKLIMNCKMYEVRKVIIIEEI